MFNYWPCTGSAICKLNAADKLTAVAHFSSMNWKSENREKKLKKKRKKRDRQKKICFCRRQNRAHGGFA